MTLPRVLVLRAPGTNCDVETAFAFQRAGGKPELVHINRLLEDHRLPSAYQILCLPGGFSYGDDISAGRILAALCVRETMKAMSTSRATAMRRSLTRFEWSFRAWLSRSDDGCIAVSFRRGCRPILPPPPRHFNRP